MTRRKRRWSDHDRHLGPFITYAADKTGPGFMLDSGDEESQGCHLRIYAIKWTILLELPPILRPYREKVIAHTWDAATVARLGCDWYWNVCAREFGVHKVDDALHIHFGRQTMDSSTHRVKLWRIPWLAWRHVRHSIYGLHGEHVRTQGKNEEWINWYDARKSCPSIWFEFDDYDGERITARTYIDEREWHRGIGWFRWISKISRPKIRRSLEIEFSRETGPKKGSWKGGTVGHGLTMHAGELHEAAFRRYCVEHDMKLVAIMLADPAKSEGA